jgi:hypothetical protein
VSIGPYYLWSGLISCSCIRGTAFVGYYPGNLAKMVGRCVLFAGTRSRHAKPWGKLQDSQLQNPWQCLAYKHSVQFELPWVRCTPGDLLHREHHSWRRTDTWTTTGAGMKWPWIGCFQWRFDARVVWGKKDGRIKSKRSVLVNSASESRFRGSVHAYYLYMDIHTDGHAQLVWPDGPSHNLQGDFARNLICIHMS